MMYVEAATLICLHGAVEWQREKPVVAQLHERENLMIYGQIDSTGLINGSLVVQRGAT